MLKFHNYDIVCQEIPDEVTLAFNITGCPNRCPGCHSPWLRDDIGNPLDMAAIGSMLDCYGAAVTCICFMGGDNEPAEVNRLASEIRKAYPDHKVAWYSGNETLSEEIVPANFDYIKIGPYVEALGGLRSETTNQKMYKVVDSTLVQISAKSETALV